MEFYAVNRRMENAKQTNPWDVSFLLDRTCVTSSLRCT